jgi:hypothetical protein
MYLYVKVLMLSSSLKFFRAIVLCCLSRNQPQVNGKDVSKVPHAELVAAIKV